MASRPPILSIVPGLKLQQLRNLLVRIGANTGGTKTALISRLTDELTTSRLSAQDDAKTQSLGPRITQGESADGSKKTRILSVDMGIKNLAFCVYDLRPGLASKLQAWRRTSLLSSPQLSL